MDKIAGQIYLILMCNTLKDYIYKVGRSINFYERKKNYNYVKILNVIDSDDIVYDESEIIKIFNKNCKLDKGREFFSTTNDSDFVLNIFLDYFINKIKINTENKNLNITNENNISNINTINTIINENIDTINNIVIEENTDTINNIVIEENKNTIINNENNIKNENNNAKNNYNNIEDRTCTNCNKSFIYPSELRKHFAKTICCRKSDEDIEKFFIQNKINKQEKNKNKSNFKCDKCNTTFVQKCTLIRHKTTSKCNKELYDKKIQLKLLQSQVDDLSKKESNKKLKN
jgi:hypothetical protein